jgi:REP element-mobilizing transposase RayT
VLPGIPRHITQRGVDRRETFSAEEDRATYLRLLRENLAESEVRVLGWCLMTNHVHLVLVPAREDSLSILLRCTDDMLNTTTRAGRNRGQEKPGRNRGRGETGDRREKPGTEKPGRNRGQTGRFPAFRQNASL